MGFKSSFCLNKDYTSEHRQQSCDVYFEKNLRPISYLGYIWVRSENQNFFCRKNKWIMEKGLTVPKWVLINRPKISQIPHNLFARSAKKFGILLRLHQVSVVSGYYDVVELFLMDQGGRLNNESSWNKSLHHAIMSCGSEASPSATFQKIVQN